MRFCNVLATLFLLVAAADGAHAQSITAETRQLVHPVLIRNDHNALLRLTVNSPLKAAYATRFEFSLTGCSNIRDIDRLELFATGATSGLSSQRRVGEPMRAQQTVVFAANIRLQKGENHFWLSCRLLPEARLTNRVDASCTRIRTNAGDVRPQDTTPNVSKRIGVALRRHFDDDVHTYRIPAIATTKNGTLLCVYDMRRKKGRDLQEDIDIGLLRSTDGGQTWEAQRVIMDMAEYGNLPQAQNGVSDPGIIVDQQTGEIFCSAVWMYGKPGKHQWNEDGSEPGFEIGKTAQFLMVRSTDDGKTWTKPENLTRKLKKKEWWLFAPSPQQGISLKDGTLVMPSQGRNEKGSPFSTLMVSKDHGRSWRVGNPAFIGSSECQAVVLGNGAIMLNMRTERPTKFRSVFTTTDLGLTWKAHPTNRKALIEPNCNGSTYRFDYVENGKAKHVLLFANPHSQTARDHHTIKVSFDDGMTWPKKYHHLLDVGRGAGYPSLTKVDEKHVGIVYEGSQSHVVFEKFSLHELLRR